MGSGGLGNDALTKITFGSLFFVLLLCWLLLVVVIEWPVKIFPGQDAQIEHHLLKKV